MIESDANNGDRKFRESLQREFHRYLGLEAGKFAAADCLKIDLHCHDYNSDNPEELWGRILKLPETWLKTKKLVKCLRNNGCDVITVTNHNNARSCWELLEQGNDLLVGAEFTCHFPEYNLFVHVLTYGFSRPQEAVLLCKRKNIYEFLHYAAEQNIPVVLPHPLYFYTRNDRIDPALFEKMAVMFQRFEVLNGQRDLWQSVLTLNWAQSLTPEKIQRYAKKHRLNPADFGVDTSRPKILTGGSDDHMGIFAGQCGSNLYIPNLAERLRSAKPSELALEAIRDGTVSPYGQVLENQKLNIALLDYFSQVATRIEDPGLLRILFHRGEVSDKLACLAIGNLMLEMQKHKNAQRFFNFVHDALRGKKPGKLMRWKIKKDYRFCIQHLEKISASKSESPEVFVDTVNHSIADMFRQLNLLIIERFKKSTMNHSDSKLDHFSTEQIARKFEVPSQISAMLFGGKKKRSDMSRLNVSDLLDHLHFPVLVALVLAGTILASTRVLYQNRRFLNDFAETIGSHRHPRRALYLTDTLIDRNGVSTSLSAKLREIQRADLPIDFLICHPDVEAQRHLHVVRPLARFSLPEFGEQEFRIPDLLEIARIFYCGGYDRIVCSTEGPMALVSLFIKHMFNVPSYFFMHTDWIEFIKDTTDLNEHERDRIRRLLRFFYKQYAGVFVLNNDHREWMIGHQMQIEKEKVFLTAHSAAKRDPLIRPANKTELFPDANGDTPVLFFASRLSREKGILDLAEIFHRVKQALPDVRIVIAGSGPAEAGLKQQLPEALYLGWVDKPRMAQLYAGLDLLIFPSRFDTFGNVVLEAFASGMPAIAYNCKGPKDIIEHGVSGYLAGDSVEMSAQIVNYFASPARQRMMREQALRRSENYRAEQIMQQFLSDLGLVEMPKFANDQSSAA
jgi:glycosyltransferase involved in cell wall biosynthesis